MGKLLHNLLYSGNKPVIVYQMAKVGSMSVFNSLLHQTTFRVYHVHALNRQYPHGFEKRLRNHFFSKDISEKKYIICPIRKPIDRNISDFMGFCKRNINIDNKSLVDLFPYYNHAISPFSWFEQDFYPVTGIDVYDYDFDKRKGFTIIDDLDIKLLIFRIELDDLMIEELIEKFLGIEEFHLEVSNVTKNDNYGLKMAFDFMLKTNSFPEWYNEMISNSKYYKHFYRM